MNTDWLLSLVLPHSEAILLGLILLSTLAAARTIKNARRKMGAIERCSLEDSSVVAATIDIVAMTKSRADWLSLFVLPNLLRLTAEYSRAQAWRVRLGAGVIIANAASSLVTGANIRVGGLTTVEISFAVTSAGSLAAALLVFGGFEAGAADKRKQADLIRLELAQFISASKEYSLLSLDRQWLLLTDQISDIIEGGIAPPSADRKGAAAEIEEETSETVL